jgi:hypothetical protein
MAGRGRWGEAATTTELPVTGSEKLKYGAATGFVPPTTWAILSAQPAYQTRRSTLRSTALSARRRVEPSERCTSSTNWLRRPSSTSATR